MHCMHYNVIIYVYYVYLSLHTYVYIYIYMKSHVQSMYQYKDMCGNSDSYRHFFIRYI